MKKDRKEYKKEYWKAHKEEAKEYMKEYMKAYRQSHKEKVKEYMKKWYQAHKEQCKAQMKAYHQAHKEQCKAYMKTYKEAHKEEAKVYMKAYNRSDVNSLGETKHSIRKKSKYILKKMKLKIPGYEIHHCFGYNDPTKFIYISKSLHLKIHQFLRDNNIEADSDHWMQIRDMVLHCNEYFYAKI